MVTASEKRRFTVKPLHNANDMLSDFLVKMWAGKSAQEAHDILAKPDVDVTNQKDKEQQLPKILKLSETVRQMIRKNDDREAMLQ